MEEEKGKNVQSDTQAPAKKRGGLKKILGTVAVVLVAMGVIGTFLSGNDSTERQTNNVEETTSNVAQTSSTPEPVEEASPYEIMLQSVQDEIDLCLTENSINSEKLRENYEFLLAIRVNEYVFKTFGYGYFTDDYSTDQYDYLLEIVKSICAEMKEYFDEEEVNEYLEYCTKMAGQSYNRYDYKGHLIGTETSPDIDAMWEIGIASDIISIIGKPSEDDLLYRDEILYKGIPVNQLLGSSYYDAIAMLGEPDTVMFDGEEITYGNASISFDMGNQDYPYLCGITTPVLKDFTYNGQTLSSNYDELTQIFGREPDTAEVVYGTYSMTYQWAHMDSFASLEIQMPATDGSTAETNVNIYWFAPSQGDTPVDNSLTLPDGLSWVEVPYTTEDQWGTTTITGVIQNNSGSSKSSVHISFNLYDADGYQIGTASDDITDFKDGSKWKFSAGIYYESAVSYEFVNVEALMF